MTSRQALVALFLLGCAAKPAVPSGPLPDDLVVYAPVYVSIRIHGDTRFYREERELAEYAANGWYQVSKGRILFVIAWDLDERTLVALKDQPRLLKVTADDPRTRAVEARHRLPANVHAVAWTHLPGKAPGDDLPLIIGVVSERAPELATVFMHEFGHAAGMDDLPAGARGVMAPTGGWKFTMDDYAECMRVRLCLGNPPKALL